MSSDLEAKKTFAGKLSNWSSIILMTIQMAATTATIIYLARNGRYKQLSWNIRFQILLFLITPPMIMIGNIWML